MEKKRYCRECGESLVKKWTRLCDSCLNTGKRCVCKNCQKVFYLRWKKVKNGKGRCYCSPDCFSAIRKKRARPKICKSCGKEYRARDSVYCSEECRPKPSKYCKHCGSLLLMTPNNRWPTYCSWKCKHNAKLYRERCKKKTKKQDRRNKIAAALRAYRQYTSIEESAKNLGITDGTLNGLILESKVYKRLSKKRRLKSEWAVKEMTLNHHTSMYNNEREFVDHAVNVFPENGISVLDVERKIYDGARQKIDIIAEYDGVAYGIEAKRGNRTARTHEAFGQVLVKCHYLNCKPVIIVPDDIEPLQDMGAVCERYGVIYGKLCDVVDIIKGGSTGPSRDFGRFILSGDPRKIYSFHKKQNEGAT